MIINWWMLFSETKEACHQWTYFRNNYGLHWLLVGVCGGGWQFFTTNRTLETLRWAWKRNDQNSHRHRWLHGHKNVSIDVNTDGLGNDLFECVSKWHNLYLNVFPNGTLFICPFIPRPREKVGMGDGVGVGGCAVFQSFSKWIKARVTKQHALC